VRAHDGNDQRRADVQLLIALVPCSSLAGLDIYFLNRATMHNVTSSAQLHSVFASPPGGMTPITPVLQHVLAAKKQIMHERKLLIIIATDGAPTDSKGEVDTPVLKHVLTRERDPARCCVTFLACTDDDSTMEYLNEWDRNIPNLDVVDDYVSERAEVLKAQGSSFNFTFGNYGRLPSRETRTHDECRSDSPARADTCSLCMVLLCRVVVKTLLGSIDPEFDQLDEVKSCCAVQ
jgi:hypothetical protein